MAITNFIPTVWSENLYKQLDQKYIGVANCSRDWEGEIKQYGDRVKICGVGPVSIFNYTKNTNLPDPTALTDSARDLIINQAKAFNFQIDDIDAAQSKPNLMDAAIRQAADALANAADKYVYGLHDSVKEGNVLTISDVNETNIISIILDAILKLQSKGVRDGLILEVSPYVASLIFKAKIDLLSNNNSTLEKGCIGSIAGVKVYVSNNVQIRCEGNDNFYQCFLRTKRAITFAEQLSEIEAYRPELRFADAVKGLHLYGAKIVYPDEILVLSLYFHDPDLIAAG